MKKIIFLLCALVTVLNAKSQTIDVISYNIRYDNPDDAPNNWDNRKAFLISQLNFYNPDVFGIQEGLIHQVKEIDEGLADYAYFGIGRDHGDERGEHTAVFYNTTRVELLEQSTFWLSTTPQKPSKGWDAALPRTCTYGIFQHKSDGKKFMVFNTHFDHVGVQARAESSKLILQKIKELNTENFPVVVTGDFNLESDSPGVQVILTQMNDTHIAAGKNAFGPDGTFNGFQFNKPVQRRIDYIFVSDAFEVLKSAILSDSKDTRYPSDHLPVFARLKY
ncbi:endonuclease/exonuclease/phosphatase family protein [Flagellimonas zhangzhouensis]|uniref:Metal-dependent hydrolase, endonuclease/exonuclease/phosphatase family n=1 Tax=Flagellimonas zhangzhouensis TaxID=1073328 RepID=A0A1H2RJW1_9FLAO|nr:endonuclease/exonuclease/phosphatase family protein [Allomuricauda zhangzhouensis]SDQ63984.1 Metal-dependent hydrolase, endonuclease/exonuclease/phosphatase family [Allomuricauda zhangzhouensis]SDW18929.1 Metal-dependent hydrolase, endonuclease/exonuclease/phosphatase family [Allomuricauda zhangzhouensis]